MATKLSGWLAEVAPGEWFILILGEFLLQRYSWLLDDAYVYFRYVDNLVLLGRGLVYNPGEFVEGFSSPAWCMLLALFRLTGCSYWLGIRILGALFFVVVWVLLVSLNRRLNPSLSKGDAINYPLIAIALTYGSSCYFTSGVEGPLVILSGVVFAFLVISPDSRGLQLAAGLGPLVRPELLVPWLFLVVYLRISRRRLPWTLISSAVCSMGVWVLFRVIYYADFFPNTFYLKSIHWYSQGFRYLWDTLLPYQLLPVILFFLLIGWMSRERMRLRLLMVLLALPVLFYVIRIGGDVRHFRYFLFPFVVLSCATGGLVESLVAWRESYPGRVWIMGLVVALSVFTLSGFPRQLQSHPLIKPRILAKSRDYRIYFRIHDAAIHRSKYTPPYSSTGAEDEFLEAKNEAAVLDVGLPQTIRVTPICRKAYHHWNERIIHSYGLTDGILSRVDVPSVRPGHKEALKPLAEDLADFQRRYGEKPGALEHGIADGGASEWMLRNQKAFRILEEKIHNRHHFVENLRLALTRVPEIELAPAGE